MNMATPELMDRDIPYSKREYVFLFTQYPINMTGISFVDLKSTCPGKDRNFNASYWHQLLSVFEMDENENK